MTTRVEGALLIALLAAGCTTARVPSSPAAATAGPVPSLARPTAATPTYSTGPTSSTSPTAALTGWWGRDGVNFCVIPAHYRLNAKVNGLGGCLGLGAPPTLIEMTIGKALDIHMTVTAYTGHPVYPLPTSSNPGVVVQTAAVDVATATYTAESPGDAVLLTVGNCLQKATTPTGADQTFGPCPLVAIHVVAGT